MGRRRNHEAGRARRPCLQAPAPGWLDSDGGWPRRRQAPVRGGRRPVVSPAARRAWRHRARAARAAVPASARTLSPQIRRRAPSNRPPSRVHAARPRKEVTPKSAPRLQNARQEPGTETTWCLERRWHAARPKAVGCRPERRILGVVVFQRPRIELLSQTGAEMITGLSGLLKLTTKALTFPCQELDRILSLRTSKSQGP